MSARRNGGRETWHRLREWDRGQSDSERLAARLLLGENYQDIDPSHPLGGRDGGKDIRCTRDGQLVIVGVYFPRGQKSISTIFKKFKSDLADAKKLGATEFVFVTNQEMSLKERADLEGLAKTLSTTIFHLERIASCLDSPKGYGLRLEFLSVEMTKEEQVSFFNERDALLHEIRDSVIHLNKRKNKADGIRTVYVESDPYDMYALASGQISISKLMECKNCEEIFRAMNPGIFVAMAMSITSPNSLQTVTCPACGKVQKY